MNTICRFQISKIKVGLLCTHRDHQILKDLLECCKIHKRHLSSNEVSVALRPFYFLVHPDLFGQFPRAHHINDASLKTLHSHFDKLFSYQKPRAITLQFYVRDKKMAGGIKSLNIQLNKSTTRETVQRILSTVDLPLKYVDSIPQKSEQISKPDIQIKWSKSYYAATGFTDLEEEVYKATKRDNLYTWLVKNMGEAERRLAASEPIRQEIAQLQNDLLNDIGLKSLTWTRGLGTTQLRGCFNGLMNLHRQNPESSKLLSNREVHFGSNTGISLEGEVILRTSDVRDQWLHCISNIPIQEPVIHKIPDLQKAVSNVLKDIEVTHRKYQHLLIAEDYGQELRRFVTSLMDYRGRRGFPESWPDSLSHLQLVVEAANGPLAVSPTGQILTPSSCPPSLLVSFITEHMKEAQEKIAAYQNIKPHEKYLHHLAQQELGLEFLEKDDSVLPEMMIECIEYLLKSKYRLTPLLTGGRLWITNYYSVMVEGEICIPWKCCKDD